MSSDNSYAEFARNSYSWHYIERPALDRAIPDSAYTDKTTVLDIGSGPGRIIAYHMDRGVAAVNLTGVEPRAKHVAVARKIFPLVRFISEKIQDTVLAPEAFDIVTAQLSLRYLDNTELADTCRNVASALRPGGRFFLLDAHPSNHVVTKSHGLENYFEEGVRYIDTPWKEPESYYYRTLGTYVNTVIDSGLTLARMDECPISDSGWRPALEADLAHYAISPVRFAVLAMKPG
jgi:SAM-dependent methyltransferase